MIRAEPTHVLSATCDVPQAGQNPLCEPRECALDPAFLVTAGSDCDRCFFMVEPLKRSRIDAYWAVRHYSQVAGYCSIDAAFAIWVLSGTVWHCLALSGTCLALSGTVWHCLALSGTRMAVTRLEHERACRHACVTARDGGDSARA